MPPNKPRRRPSLFRALLGFVPAWAVTALAAIDVHPLVLIPLLLANALSMAAVCHAIGFGPEASFTRTALRRGVAYLVMFTTYTALVLALVAWPLILLARTASLSAALALSVALAAGVAVLWRIWPAFGLVFLWDDAFPPSSGRSWISTAIARSLTFARHLSMQERFFGHFLPAACSLLAMAFGSLALTGLYGVLPAEMRVAALALYGLLVLPGCGLMLANRTLHAMLAEGPPGDGTGASPVQVPMPDNGKDAPAPGDGPATESADTRNRALLQAAREGDVTRALERLEAGADPDTAAAPDDRDQRPVIMLAALLSDTRLLRALIERGADLNAAHGGLTPLLAATRDSYHGRPEAVMMLLSNGADATVADRNGDTALHGAALSADPGVAAMLLDADADIDALNRNGLAPLAVACRAGNWPLAEFLLEHRARPQPEGGEPALVAAAGGSQDDPQGVQLLLRHKARVDAVNALGRSALMNAALEGHEAIARALLKAGAATGPADRNGTTALMEASRAGANGIVHMLLEAGADAGCRDTYGRDALILACQSPRAGAETVRLLLEAGADPQGRSGDDRSALDHAASTGRWDLVALMDPHSDCPASLDADDAAPSEEAPAGDPVDALLAALREHRWSEVARHRETCRSIDPARRAGLYLALATEDAASARQWLLEQGLDADTRDADGVRLLDAVLDTLPAGLEAARQLLGAGASPAGAGVLAIAARHAADDAGVEALCLQMLDSGADPFAADAHGWTPLQQAAALGLPALAGALLERGIDPNIRDGEGHTPMHLALRRGREGLPVLRLLLLHGADPEAATATGETPLGQALALEDPELQRWLQWHGAWRLPLRRLCPADVAEAAACGDTAAVRRLLQLGLPVDGADAHGVQALIHAAGNGHRDTVACLLDAGAQRDGTTAQGISALAAAVNARREDVVELLLERGAGANQTIGPDTRMLTLAAAQGYPDIVERLLDAGAEVNARDATGQRALHAAARFCFASGDSLRARRLLDALLARGADVCAATGEGWTPLLLLLGAHAPPGTSCDATHLGALVPVLLDAGADPAHADQRGVTALHACAMHALLPPARVLLARGADRQATDGFGRSPADVAQKLGYVDIAMELGGRAVPSVRQTLRQPASPGD